MSSPKRVVWSEGLLMSPQHLQQLDRYHEALLAQRLEALDPYAWGVVSLEIDRRALSAGELRLLKLGAILPDGTLIRAEDGSDELPPSRSTQGHFPHTKTELDVYVGLPREREAASNYGNNDGQTMRFRVQRKSVEDGTGSGASVEVGFACGNLRVLFGDEPRDDFVTIKVAEIVRDDAGGLLVSDPYIPPCPRIGASPFMIAGMRRLLGVMAQRRLALSESRRQHSSGGIEFSATDVTRFLLLNAVNRYLPLIQHFVETADVHPRTAYMLLQQLAGELCTFDASGDPAQLPKFLFDDLRGTFEVLFARITAMLQGTVKEHHVALRLEARADGIHMAQFPDAALTRCSQYLLAVRGPVPEQQLANQLPLLSKIASWGDINNILSAATPGAGVEVCYRPPPEIPVKAGTTYFVVRTDNVYWRNIVSSATIAIYLPQPFDPNQVSIELLGVPSR